MSTVGQILAYSYISIQCAIGIVSSIVSIFTLRGLNRKQKDKNSGKNVIESMDAESQHLSTEKMCESWFKTT